jgi:MipA family protein
MKKPISSFLLVGAFAGCSVGTAAASTTEPAAPERPLWEVGAVSMALSQQAYPGSDEQVNRVLLLPYFLYRGEVLRADGETTGLRAVKTPRFEVDIGFAAALGAGNDGLEARRGMPKLGTMLEFGPRLKWNLTPDAPNRWRIELPLRGVFDVSDGFTNKGFSFEPEVQVERRLGQGWNLTAGASMVWGNRKLADTFYGVAPIYALPGRAAYSADAGLISSRLQAGFSKVLTPDWRVFGFVRAESVAGAANRDSPLVRRTTGASVGIGVSYRAFASSTPGVR